MQNAEINRGSGGGGARVRNSSAGMCVMPMKETESQYLYAEKVAAYRAPKLGWELARGRLQG